MNLHLDGFQAKRVEPRFQIDPSTKTLINICSFPVYMGCTEEPIENDVHVDMLWETDSNTIRVLPVLPPEVIYPFSHNDSIGALWAQHHESFAKFINKHALGNQIYEIGGAHGMAYVNAKRWQQVKWTLHDINPIPVPEYDQRVITGKFSKESYMPAKETHTIVHSHTLEHVNNPIEFLSDIAGSQAIGDRQIISVPDMDLMLERVDLNFLNFEHNYFLPESLLKTLFEGYGYTIIEQNKFQNHSKFYALKKVSNEVSLESFVGNNFIDMTKFQSYINSVQKYVEEMNSILESAEIPTYIFGAHIFTQMLIGFGLNENLISGCIDNSPNKQNLRLYGTSLLVSAPEELFDKNGKVNIIGALANYTNEVEEGLARWQNQIHSINWFLNGSTIRRNFLSE